MHKQSKNWSGVQYPLKGTWSVMFTMGKNKGIVYKYNTAMRGSGLNHGPIVSNPKLKEGSLDLFCLLHTNIYCS